MGDVSLAELLARVPNGLSVPIGCFLVARVAEALEPVSRVVTPVDVRVSARGEISLAPPTGSRTGFAYSAPEVSGGAEPDARAAVFALGAILVEVLTGRSPFARASDMETRLAVREEPVRPLAGRVTDATHGLDALIQRALSKKPEVRFSSAAELSLRLDAFLADELFHASRESLARVVADAMGELDAAPPPEAPAPPPEAPAPPPAAKPPPALPSYADATLELTPAKRAASPMPRPALDRGVEHLGDPVVEPAPVAVKRAAVGTLDIDEKVLRQERARPKAMAPGDEDVGEAAPSWMLRIVVALVALLALALTYQFVLRPLLK